MSITSQGWWLPLVPASHPAGPSAPLLTLSLCLFHPHPSSVKPLSLSSSLLGAIDLLSLNYTPASPRPIPRVCITCPPCSPQDDPQVPQDLAGLVIFFPAHSPSLAPHLWEWPRHLPRPQVRSLGVPPTLSSVPPHPQALELSSVS